MKGVVPSKKRTGTTCSWIGVIAVASVAWVILNFYLAEKLSHFADAPPAPVLEGGNGDGSKTNKVQPTIDRAGKTPQSSRTLSKGGYFFDRKLAEDALSAHGRDAIFQPLRAYVEKKLNDTVPGTIDKGNLNEKKPKVEVGKPAKWYVPLPLRGGTPDDVSY